MVPIREPKTYSILLADDLTLVREGLAALCEAQPQFRVVGQCSEGVAALRMMELKRPDIAVLDLNLPDLFTLEIVRRAKEANLPTKIVVLSRAARPENHSRALRCSGEARFLRSVHRIQLRSPLSKFWTAEFTFRRNWNCNQDFRSGQKSAPDDPLEMLSAREYQVFTLLVEGFGPRKSRRGWSLVPKRLTLIARVSCANWIFTTLPDWSNLRFTAI
jgi:DNA-binding NarL/FixJ family response regulator